MLCFHKSLYGLKVYSKTSRSVTMSAFGKGAGVHCNVCNTAPPARPRRCLAHFRMTNELKIPWHASLPTHVGKDYRVERTQPGEKKSACSCSHSIPTGEGVFPLHFRDIYPPPCLHGLFETHSTPQILRLQLCNTLCHAACRRQPRPHIFGNNNCPVHLRRFLTPGMNFLVNILASN